MDRRAVLLFSLLGFVASSAAAQPTPYFEIRVVDDAGAPAPCVALRTVHHITLVTDDQGRAAFAEPGLMDTDVFFYITGEGIEASDVGFGFRGARLAVRPGASATVVVTRTAPTPCEPSDLESRRLARGPLDPDDYMRIDVVDEVTGRGVPLVQLELADRRWVTDSAGVIAMDPLDLVGGHDIVLRSHGYAFDDPAALDVTSGGHATYVARRINVAERLYRVTGGGIYRDSLLLGLPTPLAAPAINGLVIGQDTAFSTVFRGELFFVWGDTHRPAAPLGNFHASAATSQLPSNGGLDPDRGIDLTYFVGDDGFSRPIAPVETVPADGPTWLATLVTVPGSDGVDRLHATFGVFGPGFERLRSGMLVYDAAAERFVDGITYDRDLSYYPEGGAFLVQHGDATFVYTHEPTRMPARSEALLDESTYESFTPLVDGTIQRDGSGRPAYAWRRGQPRVTPETGLPAPERLFGHFVDADTGRAFEEHSNGSLDDNEHTGRYLRLVTPRWALGETWVAFADTPMGPWVAAQQVIRHERYTFYNPRHHRPLDEAFGRRVYFDGTYTTSFSGNDEPTPRYEYNQVMYRLDLERPELHLPVAIYRSERGELGDHSVIEPGDEPLAAWILAPVGPRPGTVPVAWSGPSCEPRRLLAGDDPPTPPIFWALPATHEPGPHQQRLYEVWPDGATQPSYTLEASADARVIAVVWRNPVAVPLPVADHLPALRVDAGPDRCMPSPGPLELAPGDWTIDGEPIQSGDEVGEGLYAVERREVRADGFVRTDAFILRVGVAPPIGADDGCGCGAGRSRSSPAWTFALLLLVGVWLRLGR